MPEYKSMYLLLFNRVTDALGEIERGNMERARELLQQAQLETEELYISAPEEA